MPPSFSAPVGRSESRITPSSALPRWCRPLVSAMMRVRLAPASGIIALCGRKPMSVSLAQRRSDGSSSVSFVLLCVRSYLLRYRGRKGDSYIFRHLLLVPHATQSRKTAQKAPAASFAANIARTKTKHHARDTQHARTRKHARQAIGQQLHYDTHIHLSLPGVLRWEPGTIYSGPCSRVMVSKNIHI